MQRRRHHRNTKAPILDEQEQDEIINTLRADNLAARDSFRVATSILCVLVTLVFAYLTKINRLLITTLSISSLVMTIFTLQYLPNDSSESLDSPLARFLPFLNAVVAVLVPVMALMRPNLGTTLSQVLTSVEILPILMFTISSMLRMYASQNERSIIALEKQKYVLRGV